MVDTQTRYTIVSVRKMVDTIEGWIEQTEETLGNEESKDYPNEDRLDSLQTRLDALQQALEALGEIE